ncbi:unnamed protein product [Microthlaspi erraticum]|uniref:Retrotransposon gag domain-containing protein n=1 Tax=Microthlaspi erraticum TaxID=1685480 RepID=A0A6D2IL68_9BRAS|nr:unnamed protein product [Microthlaspi erraticum]
MTVKECEERILQLEGSLGEVHREVSAIKAGCESMSSRLGVLETQMTAIVETLSRIEAITFSDCGRDKGIALPSISLPQVPNALPLTDGTIRSIGYRRIVGAVENQESMLKTVEMHAFDGRLPYGWISRAERFFRLGNCDTDEEKLYMVSSSFSGDALIWYKEELAKSYFKNWPEFKDRLLARFALVKLESLPEVVRKKTPYLQIVQQTELVQKFESPSIEEFPLKSDLKGKEVLLKTKSIPEHTQEEELSREMQKKIPKAWKCKYKTHCKRKLRHGTASFRVWHRWKNKYWLQRERVLNLGDLSPNTTHGLED